jgi:hypothetical protein
MSFHVLRLLVGPFSLIPSENVSKNQKIIIDSSTVGGVEGATQIRQYDATTTSLHLGGVFKIYPELCPKGKRQVTIGIETDTDGQSFLAIDLQTPMIKRTSTRLK